MHLMAVADYQRRNIIQEQITVALAAVLTGQTLQIHGLGLAQNLQTLRHKIIIKILENNNPFYYLYFTTSSFFFIVFFAKLTLSC
jgi:hypothetical protein